MGCDQKNKDQTPVTLVQGAEVFRQGEWERVDFYISDREILFSTDATIKDTIKANGKYITPGFVDAHTHNLDRIWQKGLINKYIDEGTLAIQNLTSKSKGVKKFRKLLDTIQSPYVKYSNWGFTSTLGHPFTAYEPYVSGIRDYSSVENSRKLDSSRIDLYNSYAFVDSIPQLKTIWPDFLKTNPDIVKVYFFNENEIEKQIKGNHGLRYEVAKAIIDSSHANNLKVYAHIGNVSDFEKMLDAGIDGFAHSPEYNWNGNSATLEEFRISDKLLKRAASENIVIIPTAAINFARNKNDPKLLNAVAELQTSRIKRFRELGGIIAPGSGASNRTGETLYKYYAEYIDLPATEKLSIFTEESSKGIFPERKIGKIADGYLANFLIFSHKPFENERWDKREMVFIEGKKSK